MKILVSNDDGYLAPGLIALVDALRPIAEIVVVAPDSNRSGSSNSLTLAHQLQWILQWSAWALLFFGGCRRRSLPTCPRENARCQTWCERHAAKR